MTRMRLTLLCWSAVAALGACTVQEGGAPPKLPGNPGYATPSSGGLTHDPMDVDDGSSLSLAAARGVDLHWRDRVYRVAMSRGVSRMAKTSVSTLLPVASADPGYHSGQLAIYRWRQRDIEEVDLAPENGQKWMVVPVLLRPDRVLELEQFDYPVQKNSAEAREIEAVMVATNVARAEYSGGRWRMFAYPEVATNREDRLRNLTRVYMLSEDDQAPDLDVLVADRVRRSPAKSLGLTVHHAPAAWERELIEVNSPQPTTMTVTRLVSREVLAREFEVLGSDGSRWSVHSETGAIERLDGPDNEDAETPGEDDARSGSAPEDAPEGAPEDATE
ncbi:MAG: hypothetical protein ACPHRO_06760 [Nannocystaceae bacterium]